MELFRSIRQKSIRQKNLRFFVSIFSLSAKKIFALPQNEWAALAAAHEKIGLLPDSRIVVRPTGIEPVVFSFGGQYFIH